ncbi:hypothetical protein [Streptodolium elevatio]|uniref:Uncharacterized protein n=1 Tax=Streptodolium elevatio TaxID=3157996 RepID=A0ABV3DUB4_9ACTN
MPPIPLTFSVREADGSWIVSGTVAQASEVVDLLTHSANGTVVVMDLATTSFWSPARELWDPSLVAAEVGVECVVHRVGAWAAATPGLSDELLVMRRSDLPRFLDGSWSPYELSIIDVPDRPNAARLDEIALAVGTASFDGPVLPHLADSRVWYRGHDDCFLRIETTDPAMPVSVFGRLLALSARSSLTGGDTARSSVAVPQPDTTLTARLIHESPRWLGIVDDSADPESRTARILLSALPEPWRLGGRPPEQVDHTATFDLGRGTWEFVAGR